MKVEEIFLAKTRKFPFLRNQQNVILIFDLFNNVDEWKNVFSPSALG